MVLRSVREHLNQSAEIGDTNFINTHIARIEVQSDQVVIELTNAKGIGPKRSRGRNGGAAVKKGPIKPARYAIYTRAAARWTGISSDSRRSRFFAPAYSSPEDRMPSGSQFSDIETAQTRDLVVERGSIRHRRIDHNAWHGAQTVRRRERREAEPAPPLATIR